MAQLAVAILATTTAFAAGFPVSSADVTTQRIPTTATLATCKLAPSADAYVDKAQTSTSFGTTATLKVRSQQTGNQRALLRFDVASCGISPTASVRRARLELYLNAAPSTSRSYAVYPLQASWGETTVTWTNQPASGPATAATATGTAAGVTLAWDVKADVAGHVAAPSTNFGWLLADAAEGLADPGIGGELASREHATSTRRPVLLISYYP